MQLCDGGDATTHTQVAFEDGDDCPVCELQKEREAEQRQADKLVSEKIDIELAYADLEAKLARMKEALK